MLQLVLNPDYGDITDPDSGTDLVITYGKIPGSSFPRTEITPRRRSSPLQEDTQVVAEILDSIPEMDDMFERKAPEEVGVMLDSFLSGDASAESSSSETAKYGSDATPAVTDSVDQAFDELLG